jgi:hypothetical protein
MTKQTPEDRKTANFRVADQKIQNLLKWLGDQNVCPCCTARALAWNAADMAAEHMGSAAAIELFEEIIDAVRELDSPPPAHGPSTEKH